MSPPKTLTNEQCETLLVYMLKNHGTHKQLVKATRNTSMAIVMLETGLRVGELCGLRLDDLWYSEQPVSTLVVRKDIAKTKSERHIPVSRKLTSAISMMNDVLWSPVEATNSSYAFFAHDPSMPLTTRSVERVIQSSGQKALNFEITPHWFRHTFASKMMRKTNASVVQALLGHTNLQSTQIYMHPNSEDLRKAIDEVD